MAEQSDEFNQFMKYLKEEVKYPPVLKKAKDTTTKQLTFEEVIENANKSERSD